MLVLTTGKGTLMAYDLVIRNGTLVDGTGSAPYQATATAA